MGASQNILLEIPQGRTFYEVLRWAQPRIAYRSISAATAAAPCVLTTSAPHDLPPGWPFTVSKANGMTELNSIQIEGEAPRVYKATVIDAATVEINDLNAVGFRSYTGGGIIEYAVPVDLAPFTGAALQARSRIDSTEILLSLTTDNGGIVLDNANRQIVLTWPAVSTAAFDWTRAVWDLEAFSAGGIVTPVARGEFIVCREVTR